MPAFTTAALRQLTEFRSLVLLLTLSALAWVFAELADEVTEGATTDFDERVLLALRHPADPADPLGPIWLEELMRDATAFGGTGTLTFITLVTAGFLALQRRGRSALFMLAAVASGALITHFAKLGFDRPRPELVPHEAVVFTTSFPSGHSMMAAVTFLTLAAILARAQRRRAVKIYLLTIALVVTLTVGVSRVYLGVHWPTDVMAGWTLGAGWALGCWLIALWLGITGRIEPEPVEEA